MSLTNKVMFGIYLKASLSTDDLFVTLAHLNNDPIDEGSLQFVIVNSD